MIGPEDPLRLSRLDLAQYTADKQVKGARGPPGRTLMLRRSGLKYLPRACRSSFPSTRREPGYSTFWTILVG